MEQSAPIQSARPLAPPPARRPESFLLGDLPGVNADRVRFLVDTPRDYGPMVKVRFGPMPFYLATGPAQLEHVLQKNAANYIKNRSLTRIIGGEPTVVTSEGGEWLWRRRLMQPNFQRNHVAQFATVITDETEKVLARWSGASTRGERAVTFDHETRDLTMQIIGRAMFSLDMSQEGREIYDAYDTMAKWILERGLSVLKAPLFVPTPGNLAFKRANRVICDALAAIIDARERDQVRRGDLLDQMLEARLEDDSRKFTRAQAIAETATLLFAGHETTANTLAWVFYLLASHADQEEALHAELDAVLGGRTPTADDLPALVHTRRIIDETLRLYPTCYLTLREAIGADAVAEHDLRPGSKLLINFYGLHRLPELWDEPDRFDPERFTEERSKARPKFAYVPFGGGTRQCLGGSLAMLEAVLIVAMIGQRFRLRPPAGYVAKPDPAITLRPKGGLPMALEPR